MKRSESIIGHCGFHGLWVINLSDIFTALCPTCGQGSAQFEISLSRRSDGRENHVFHDKEPPEGSGRDILPVSDISRAAKIVRVPFLLTIF
jgi:hypothetical protein